MAFKKGQSGNPAGRKPGTPNKFTSELRQRIESLLNDKFEQIAADFEKLEPLERINAWTKLTDFVLPKLQRSEMEAVIHPTPENSIDTSLLTDEELKTMVALLEKSTVKTP